MIFIEANFESSFLGCRVNEPDNPLTQTASLALTIESDQFTAKVSLPVLKSGAVNKTPLYLP